MYNIAGDGSYNNTIIFKDGKPVVYTKCDVFIDQDGLQACVDGEVGVLDKIILSGYHRLVGLGDFSNTVLYTDEVPMRGVQNVHLCIEKKKHTQLDVEMVWLPNIVEGTKC